SRAVPLTSSPARAGTVLWGEAYDSQWSASRNGHSLRQQRAFGWGNSFAVSRAGRVSVAYGAQWQRWAALAVALIIWLLVVWRWRRTRVRRDRVARAATARTRRERRERRERYDPLADVLDEDSFWWERV